MQNVQTIWCMKTNTNVISCASSCGTLSFLLYLVLVQPFRHSGSHYGNFNCIQIFCFSFGSCWGCFWCEEIYIVVSPFYANWCIKLFWLTLLFPAFWRPMKSQGGGGLRSPPYEKQWRSTFRTLPPKDFLERDQF